MTLSNITGQDPGQDLPDPILPGSGDNDAIGRPDGGPGIGNDLPTKPAGTNAANEPDPTTPMPTIPGVV
ncbi:hypothetical protein [Aureimonas sp. AU12]|uniref:hypothetical protein n=1 Tax=Aureimonas sp. AU12 TaxID=1638161 RepID=UPI00078452B4|nr:hypothetical protein [Aureimonas sp. AU12]